MSMEPIVQLSGKYREELAATFEGLRQRSTLSVQAAQEQLQALQQQAEQLKSPDNLVGTLQDLSSVEIPTAKVLDTYGWLAVMSLTTGFIATFSSFVLAPVLGLFFENFSAVLLAYGVVPALLFRQVQATENEQEQRFYLLSGAAAEGLLIGFILANRYLPSLQPLTALTPLFIALAAQLGEGKFPSRQAFLGATLGSGFAAHFVLGLLFGTLSFANFLLILSYAGVGFATLQLQLKEPSAPISKYQLLFFTGIVFAHGLVFLLFGGATPPAAASN